MRDVQHCASFRVKDLTLQWRSLIAQCVLLVATFGLTEMATQQAHFHLVRPLVMSERRQEPSASRRPSSLGHQTRWSRMVQADSGPCLGRLPAYRVPPDRGHAMICRANALHQ